MFQIDPSTAATNSKGNRKGRAQPSNERSDFDFALDLDRILNGSERRTTIMVCFFFLSSSHTFIFWLPRNSLGPKYPQ